MSSKIKRKFLIATQGDSNWYRALSEKELARSAHPKDALFIEQPLKDANVLSASDKYNLLHIAARQSTGVKKDLAAALAAQIVARPSELAPIVDKLTEQELFYRADNLDLAAGESLFVQHGEKEYDHLMEDLSFLRSLPNESYLNLKTLLEITANRQTAEDSLAIVKDSSKQPEEKKKDIESFLLNQLDSTSIIRWADSYGFHYGDGFNEYDGPSREEAKVYFDVSKSLMLHWDEAGKSSSGKPYDAFAAGKEGHRYVFLKSEFVQKLKP